jgi:deoxyadenosine/deoxycytidine kinase
MRIGIIGTHGVGKTTLLNVLRAEPEFGHYDIVNEVTRTVKREGFNINEQGDDATQLYIGRLHCQNIILHPNLLTDRTLVDCYCYTHYLYKRGKVLPKTLDLIWELMNASIDYFDKFFFIKPEFALEADGDRTDSVFFQKRIDQIFEATIDNKQNLRSKVVRVTGTVLERATQVKEALKNNGK